jgi:serine/threonine protein kinase
MESMSEPNPPRPETYPDLQREKVCDRFEAQWKAGNRPKLEEFLPEAPADDDPALFAELLNLELSYRADRGERPTREEYGDRFPRHHGAIAAVFDAGNRVVNEPPRPTDAARRREEPVNAQEEGQPLLDQPVPVRGGVDDAQGPMTAAYIAAEAVGTVIAGRYKLLEAIGEGGMGTVWVAKQTEPVKRKVALKLIKAGMDSKSMLARFEAERQALALMDHPNIARVLDGGLTHAGRPFFVMDYVKGVPITQYCDATRLSVAQRLELFVQVCQAVQHAHQKGIIHRDLKPSNILVAPYDGKPVPKIIDFGLAKAMHQSLTERTLHTAHESVLGTPLYMSPEQAQLNNLDVDTRSDIYSLGVLLYELLTGTTPLERKRFKEAAWEEIRRIIREEEPPRPSTRLSSIDTLPSLAAGRTEPAKLSKLVRGDLDWITMKALEKDRSRRYETANGFAMDVQRHLSGEPVQAAPPSTRYRLRKFAKKHRTALTTAATILLLLVAGVAISTWQAVRATRAEMLALDANAHLDAANTKLTSSNQKEREARQEEERQRKFAEAIRDFVQDDFLALTSVEGQHRFGGEGKETLGKDTSLGQLLDWAAEKLRARKGLDPEIEAELCWIVGVNYRGTGDAAKGVPFLERALALRKQVLGLDRDQTFDAQNSLAVCYGAAGQHDQALSLLEETLKRMKAKLGPDHPSTLTCMGNLASACKAAGQLDLALPLFEETLKLMKTKLGPDDRATLIAMTNLAGGYRAAGQLDLALPLFEETLKLMKVKLGPDHLTRSPP